MAKKAVNNWKLGIFVLAGLVFLVLLLYMIGKNRNLFGNTYVLKARFENVQGLVPGNNVRFSGIQAGTVKRITILNDTVIEVTMMIETKMKKIIRKNAVVSIGTDGLVGNKVVNIAPAKFPLSLAAEGDILVSRKALDTDEMLQTLYRTNNDVAVITDGLKTTVQRLNNSTALWSLLNDQSIPSSIRTSLSNIRHATERADKTVMELNELIAGIKNGEGTLGLLLSDSSFAENLKGTILTIKNVGIKSDSLASGIVRMFDGVEQDIIQGNGAIHSLLKDTMLVNKLNASLDNIQKGTDGFNQNMEALKHNFLFRGYFRKQEKKKVNTGN
jgi:phospholipid/cholesterol/gamma-HCH transport system substrate-binding protein